MQAAKDAVNKFTGRHGHTTEVNEHVQSAVTNETVKPTRHEEHTQAIDREVHQDHYHTTVQPLQHQEVLPEKHTHNVAPTEKREFHHGNESETRERLQHEASRFRDTSTTHDTQHTQSAGQTQQGEHVHHHVHETVQPVINKQTIQPEKVHTTVPIHELHHADSQHHGTSVLPTKNLSEFKQSAPGSGGHQQYEGVPRAYNKDMQLEPTETDRNPLHKGVDGPQSHHTGGTKLSGNEPFADDGHLVQGGTGGSTSERLGHTGGGGQTSNLQRGEREYESGGTGRHMGTDGGIGQSGTHTSSHMDNTRSGNTGGQKPSLMDKINPKVDATGDGKAGFMK